jgi:hypothetical protein
VARDAKGRFLKGSGGPPAPGSRVLDKDNGYDALLERLRQGAARLTVGIHEAEGSVDHGDGVTVAEIGEFHEFGLGVPRRSFIADWADEGKAEHDDQLRKMAIAIVKGSVPSARVGLERLGNLYVGEVQRRIAGRIDPPLEQATIDRKGSSVPLIDKGILRSSVTFKVVGE